MSAARSGVNKPQRVRLLPVVITECRVRSDGTTYLQRKNGADAKPVGIADDEDVMTG